MKKGLLLYLGPLVCFGIVGCVSGISTNNNDFQFIKKDLLAKVMKAEMLELQ